MVEAKTLIACQDILGEGSWYDFERDCLIWTDIWGCKVWEYFPGENRTVCHKTEAPVTTFALGENGYILGTDRGVAWADMELKNMRFENCPNEDYTQFRCNDGKCGPDGKFWIGIMERHNKPGVGTLYTFDGKNCELVQDHLNIPNGIVWNSALDTMYFTDTSSGNIYAYDYKDGKVSGQRTIFHIDQYCPDGMCIDEEDKIWVAVWGTGSVYRIDPITGTVMDTIHTAAPQVASVAVGNGKVYITSARAEMSEEALAQYPESGNVFVADYPVKGSAPFRYKPVC